MSQMAPPPDHQERLQAARRLSRYEIGDPGWADVIVAAYLDPDSVDVNGVSVRGRR